MKESCSYKEGAGLAPTWAEAHDLPGWRSWLQSLGQQENLCCIVANIDGFNRFNYDFGHAQGDHLLVAYQEALSAAVPDGAWLYQGADRFFLLLPGSRQELESRLPLLPGTVSHPQGLGEPCSISYGYAARTEASADVGPLVTEALADLAARRLASRSRVPAASEK